MVNNMNALVTAEYTNAISSDGIEIVIDNRTGESFVTASGYSRMAGVDRRTVIKRLQGCDFFDVKTAESYTASELKGCDQGVQFSNVKRAQIKTAGGLQGVQLIPGSLARKWLAKDKPELLAAMAEAGWNVFLHKLAGYKSTNEPKQLTREQQIAQALIWSQEEVEKLKETVDELVQEQAVLTPKANAFDRFLSDEGLMTVEDFAKTANVPGIGTNKMFELLREYEYIQAKPSVLPYQRHIASGLFEVKQVPGRGSSYVNGPRYFKQVFITRKGVEQLSKKLGIA